jgi:hypothetical protein
VIAVIDDHLLTLAQTGYGRYFRLGGRGVLGQGVVVLGRDDPASTRPWNDAQATGSG